MGEFAIGQGVPRFEDPRLLRGGGKYVDDIVLPGMAFGHVLRSPHAHAKIKSIDTSKAKAAPGVLCVLTGEDWIKSGWGDLPVPGTHKRRDGSTNYKPRYPALVKDRVRFVGDYVAFVVAETKNQAMDACRADRGRLRDRCRPRSPPPMPPSPARRSSGTTARTTSASPRSTATRPRPRRRSPTPRMW